MRSKRGEYFVLYRRRRVGKSRLLLHFGERCRQFYFEASSGSRQDQLEDLSAELAAFTGSPLYAEQPLTSWRAVFAAFSELLAAGQTMIVLDEFHHLGESRRRAGPDFPGKLGRIKAAFPAGERFATVSFTAQGQ